MFMKNLFARLSQAKRLGTLALFSATLFFAVLILSPVAIFAQPMSFQGSDYTRLAMMNQRSKVYVEALTYPTLQENASSKSGVVVRFRIPYDRLVFVRNREATKGNEFVAEVKVNVELSKERQRVTDETWTQKVFASTFEESKDRLRDVQGQVHFEVDAGMYAYRININEQNGMLHPIVVPNYAEGNALSEATPMSSTPQTTLNLGGDVEYGQGSTFATFFSLKPNAALSDASLSYTLYKLSLKNINDFQRRMQDSPMRQLGRMRNNDEAGNADESGRNRPLPSGQDEPSRGMMEMPKLPPDAEKIMEGQVNSAQIVSTQGIVLNELPLSKNAYQATITLGDKPLADGVYILQMNLKTSDGIQTSIHRFATHWRNMPASLLNLDVAIDNLKFVVEKNALRDLKRGSAIEKEAKFKAFWQAKDPSPNTEFNELMSEYYRRIDEAAVSFQTGTGLLNGHETDRGKIFIANGAPIRKERTLPDSGGVRETWTYSDGKTYVFEAASSLDAFELIGKDRVK
jgi:GWxTD domain-containing protein